MFVSSVAWTPIVSSSRGHTAEPLHLPWGSVPGTVLGWLVCQGKGCGDGQAEVEELQFCRTQNSLCWLCKSGFAMESSRAHRWQGVSALRLYCCLGKWAGCKRLHSLSFSLKAALKLGYPLSGILRQLIITLCLEEGLDIGPSNKGIPGVGLQSCFPCSWGSGSFKINLSAEWAALPI